MAVLRVLVTGKQGQLVRSLLEVGPARGIEIVAVGRPELELTDPRSISAVIAAQRPAVLVHAAGYTDTEHAEVEPALAHAINVDGAAAVATAARTLAVPMIHLSSAYVFDGTSGAAYREDAALHPLGVYGRTKALGEAAVVAAKPDHVILRASMVFSPFGRNTLTNLLRRTEQRDALEVVDDQRLNPTSALDLAGAIADHRGESCGRAKRSGALRRVSPGRPRRREPGGIRRSAVRPFVALRRSDGARDPCPERRISLARAPAPERAARLLAHCGGSRHRAALVGRAAAPLRRAAAHAAVTASGERASDRIASGSATAAITQPSANRASP